MQDPSNDAVAERPVSDPALTPHHTSAWMRLVGAPTATEHPPIVRFGVAVALSLIAFVMTDLLESHVQRALFIFFWPAVIGSAWFGGIGPAVLASLLAILSVDRFFIAPSGARGAGSPGDLVPLALFLFASGVVSSLTEALRIARARAAAIAGDDAIVAGELEQQSAELEQQLEESQVMQEELEQASAELAERTAAAEAAEGATRGILDSIAEPFVVHDKDWRFLYINEPAAAIFRSSRHADAHDPIGKVLWDTYPELAGTVFEVNMRRAKDQRVAVTFEGMYQQRGEWSELRCYPLPGGGVATQWKNITARKRAEESARFLARAADLLASSLDYEKTLGDLARLAVPELADWCAVDMLSDDGTLHQLAVAHVDPEKARWAREINRRYPHARDAATGVLSVLRTGRPEMYNDITDEMIVAGAIDAEHLRITRELGLTSMIIVPLTARERTLGALTLVAAESKRRYSDADLALAMELARRAAVAVDNARLHRSALEAREAADAANLAKTQFLAVMSHELRTPLNAIAGYAELLRMGIRGPVTPEQEEDLDRIARSQRALLSLINDVLNYAKLEAGHVQFDSRPIAVHALLLDIEALVTPQLLAQRLAYACAPCDPELLVQGDAEKVRQILLNLLSNAIKFTARDGHVGVRCEASAATVSVHVTDSGTGIPSNKLAAIFEPFIQLDRSLSSSHEGTGLGLSISRDLARAMGGDLTVESAVGAGSTFTLSLPRA
ncbi:MAG: ATP-binding protein [Gemmatimonadaceae bacterium]